MMAQIFRTYGGLLRGVLVDELFAPPQGAARWARQAMLVAIGVAAIVIASKLRIPLWPAPVTMQTFAVLSLGAAYGPRLGVATVFAWLFLGALGADVFAGADAAPRGLAYLLGGTGGYLAGFALAAAIVGWLAERGWDRAPLTTAAAMAIGNVVIYIPGLLWLGRLYGFDAPLLEWGLYPYLIGDALKLALSAAAFPLAWRAVRQMRG